jgi:clan AA aspartic protease (TIGR02281 family)
LPDQPLSWYPLDGSRTEQRILVTGVQYLRDFARIDLAAENAVPGFFIQDERLVGWSFGDLLRGGYLWTGSRGGDLAAEFYIDDFYRLTFAGGREEAFLLALADKGLSDLRRLEALAAAFRLETRLRIDDTPTHLRPAAIQATMRQLILQINTQDGADELLSILDPPTVIAIGSPDVAADLIQLAWDQGGYGYALELIEALEEEAAVPAASFRNLPDLQAAIYRDWLDRLIVAGDQDEARQIYQTASSRFPLDPAIHLVGVELALANQDWALAERLLAEQRYPADLRDKVSRLQQEITDLKSQEGKIVIRFRPGSRTIPVVAQLARGLDQRFVIDTGASLVTVPSTTVRQLGIDIADNLPRRLFYSATGVQNAVEITLPAIELNGWVVENVKALVVDLPGQPEVGLLGMNYLNNFRMDVNTAEGMVMLTPR